MPAPLGEKQPLEKQEEHELLPTRPAPFIHPAAFDAAAAADQPAPNAEALRLRRRWIGAGAALAIVALALSAWQMLGPSTPAGDRVAAGSGSAPVWAEPVRQAIEAYKVRARLFADHEMTCKGLARGLEALDAHWVTYSLRHRPAGAGGDARPVTVDAALTQQVDQIEDDFRRTGCPRP